MEFDNISSRNTKAVKHMLNLDNQQFYLKNPYLEPALAYNDSLDA